MLVVLPSKEVSERWAIFKECLRNSIPRTKDMLPNWLSDSLFLALTGRIQCWLAYDPADKEDEFYAAMVTKKVSDELTGQSALLIYAAQVFKRARKEVRLEDLQTLRRIAKSYEIQRITAYCLSPVTANLLQKAFPELERITFVSIPIN